MSFQEQERALFDLVFDSTLRDEFCKNKTTALQDYGMSDAEKADFETIRLDGLLLDAKMRVYLLLSHWSKSFPVTFSIISSLDDGIDTLKHLVDVHIMRTAPVDRLATYGERLKQWLEIYAMDSEEELARIKTILNLEYGMVLAEATLKRSILNGESKPLESTDFSDNWLTKKLQFAPQVCAVLLPQPYTKLKESLCPCIDDGFWKQLSSQPLSRSQVNSIMQQEDPRLLVTRAVINRESKCEPVVDQQTIELSEGFAPLFQYINGSTSVDDMLNQLQLAGAEDSLLQSVKSGFKELLEKEMLKLV